MEQPTNSLATNPAVTGRESIEHRWGRVQIRLRSKFGDEVFSSWFARLEVEELRDNTLFMTVPTQFLRTWIQNHYQETLLECASAEIEGTERVMLTVRERGSAGRKDVRPNEAEVERRADAENAVRGSTAAVTKRRPAETVVGPAGTDGGGYDGSPLDPKLTFETFVVGGSNRMAHAAAKQIAETALDQIRYNPLFIHSSVGLGKTHLLHAIAWEVKRRNPHAQILYLTAERFRSRFVDAVRSQGAAAFKEKLRGIDILLVDDMEFLQGDRTEQEFDHTLNALLDGGKQVVVASARAPMQLGSLDNRMRSRLSGGLVTEIIPFDYDLRLQVLERRLEERRRVDPTFHIEQDVLVFLAERLTESGRQLDGTMTKLYMAYQVKGLQITQERAEAEIRDLMRGIEPRRIKVEDILRVVSKQYGVSRIDILSKRRQRSIVYPRQIGMWLAKSLTQRSLPEIGRRFGNRDHTTVLHAIRKIEKELQTNSRLRSEIDDLKRMLSGGEEI
jgi:chromosomal replication initiator protein